MITKQIRQTIKGCLEGFIQGIMDEKTASDFDLGELRPLRTGSKKGDLKPYLPGSGEGKGTGHA